MFFSDLVPTCFTKFGRLLQIYPTERKVINFDAKVYKFSSKTTMAKVLILDQSKSMRNTLRERLEFEGFSTEAAEDEAAAARLCENIPFDVILSDSSMHVPDAGIPFIVISSDNDIDSAVRAVRSGASDFLTKPVDMNRLLKSLRSTVEHDDTDVQSKPHAVRARKHTSTAVEPIIGQSPEMQHVRDLIDKVAQSEARVLITGENGTGKELVARWLHEKSHRSGAPFVEVNCAAIPSELIESELFGHEKGAFTSAIKQRKGKFEQANGGTLFMDEIGDMSLSAQAKVRHEQESARRDSQGQLPRRPLSPYRRHRDKGSGAARPCRRHTAARRLLHIENMRGVQHTAQKHCARGRRSTETDALERQYPRTAQRNRASDRSERREHHGRRHSRLLLTVRINRTHHPVPY